MMFMKKKLHYREYNKFNTVSYFFSTTKNEYVREIIPIQKYKMSTCFWEKGLQNHTHTNIRRKPTQTLAAWEQKSVVSNKLMTIEK